MWEESLILKLHLSVNKSNIITNMKLYQLRMKEICVALVQTRFCTFVAIWKDVSVDQQALYLRDRACL